MGVRLDGRALREIRTLFDQGAMGSWTDGQLVAELPMGGDGREAALRVLIERHGPMVLGVCRRILGDEAAAEDAFQATFVVVVRRADSLRGSVTLKNWIFGAALRIAKKERARVARRRVVESRAAAIDVRMPSQALEQDELRSIIDEEVGMLSERYRLPVILCYLEGMRHDEAARRLGCAVGTVESRLSRAKERLRGRLARRGLAPEASAIGLALSARDATAMGTVMAMMERTIVAASGVSPGMSLSGVGIGQWLGGLLASVGQMAPAGAVVSGLVVCAGLAGVGYSGLGGGEEPPRPNAAPAVILAGGNGKADAGQGQDGPVTVEIEAKARLKIDRGAEGAQARPTPKEAAVSKPEKVSKVAEPVDTPALRELRERPLTDKMLKPERGATAYAPIVGKLTIDGDLSDWPPAIARYPIDKLLLVNGLGTSGLKGKNLSTDGDLSAAFSIGYSPSEQLVYVAVIVRDDKTILGHESHLDTDALEIFVDGLHEDRQLPIGSDEEFLNLKLTNVPVQQYIAIPGKGMIYGKRQASNPVLMAGSLKNTKSRMEFTVKGDVATYEWAIQVFDNYPDKPTKLEPGKRIGFDVAVIDKDAPASTPGGYGDPEEDRSAWIFWSPLWRGNKMLDSGALGEVILVK